MYPNLVTHEMSPTQLRNLITNNTVGGLEAGVRAVWLHRSDHTMVWIIIADEHGTIIRDGKLPLRILPNVIGAASQSKLELLGSATCHTIVHLTNFILRAHPNAEFHTMHNELKRRFAELAGHRNPESAVIIWVSRPNTPTVLVVTFHNGCRTSLREFPREMIETLELGSLI